MNRFVCLAALISGIACSSSPADVAGSYSVQVTDGSNGCMFVGYAVGSSFMNVPVTITQDGASVTATVTGLVGAYLVGTIGSAAFAGSIDGSTLNLTLDGQHPYSTGDCAYTYNGALTGDISGDNLSGTIDYTADTNHGSDCTAALVSCVTEQQFAGSRPPQ